MTFLKKTMKLLLLNIIFLFHTKYHMCDAVATYIDYRGCFNEMPNRYNFFWWPKVWDRNNKVDCIDKCYSQTFAFAAINNRDDCYCGNGYLDTYGSSRNCYNVTINRVPSTVGNRMSSAVYATGKMKEGRQAKTNFIEERYIGCWRGKTAIFGSHFVVIAKGDPRMTIEKCIVQCTNQSHIFSAIGLGTNCYCGNTLEYGSKVQPTGSAMCQSPCSGAPQENCGSAGNEDIIAVFRSIPKQCMVGYYGRYCRMKCSCAGYGCDRETGVCVKKCTSGSTLPQCRIDDGQYNCHSCLWSNTSFVRSSNIRFLTQFFANKTSHEPTCGDPFPLLGYNGSSCANATFCLKFNFTLNSVHYIVRDCLQVKQFSCTPFQNRLQSVAMAAGVPSLDFACCLGDFCNGGSYLCVAVPLLLSVLAPFILESLWFD